VSSVAAEGRRVRSKAAEDDEDDVFNVQMPTGMQGPCWLVYSTLVCNVILSETPGALFHLPAPREEMYGSRVTWRTR